MIAFHFTSLSQRYSVRLSLLKYFYSSSASIFLTFHLSGVLSSSMMKQDDSTGALPNSTSHYSHYLVFQIDTTICLIASYEKIILPLFSPLLSSFQFPFLFSAAPIHFIHASSLQCTCFISHDITSHLILCHIIPHSPLMCTRTLLFHFIILINLSIRSTRLRNVQLGREEKGRVG